MQRWPTDASATLALILMKASAEGDYASTFHFENDVRRFGRGDATSTLEKAVDGA
jgi:hypothetical protein